jgi:ubiquinone biosynthesis protein Coq4
MKGSVLGMQTTQELHQAWQDDAIASIIDFVKAELGDLNYAYKLANALDEPYGMQKIVEFVSQTPPRKTSISRTSKVRRYRFTQIILPAIKYIRIYFCQAYA